MSEPQKDFHEGDQAVLDRLRELGSDLRLPRRVDYYFYFPSQAAAEKAAEALRAGGYEVKVRLGAYDVNWLALATNQIVVSAAMIARVRAGMESLANSLGGEYDGWETEV